MSDRFTLPDEPASGAGIDLTRVHRKSHRGGDFCLTLGGYGFEATRYLTPDEARTLRDWLTAELGAAS